MTFDKWSYSFLKPRSVLVQVENNNIDLIEGQTEYTFYRASGDGTSSSTNATANVYGVADILEATLRTDRTATDQADSALTKIDRSTYSALSW